jgi:hypothetical protein
LPAMKGSPAHRLVGLVAAYAVAVSALLPVLAAVLPPDAALTFRIICSRDAPGGSSDHGVPIKPQPPCPCPGCCTTSCCGPEPPLPSGVLAIEPAPAAGAAPVRFASSAVDPRGLRLAGSNRARAPPLV